MAKGSLFFGVVVGTKKSKSMMFVAFVQGAALSGLTCMVLGDRQRQYIDAVVRFLSCGACGHTRATTRTLTHHAVL